MSYLSAIQERIKSQLGEVEFVDVPIETDVVKPERPIVYIVETRTEEVLLNKDEPTTLRYFEIHVYFREPVLLQFMAIVLENPVCYCNQFSERTRENIENIGTLQIFELMIRDL